MIPIVNTVYETTRALSPTPKASLPTGLNTALFLLNCTHIFWRICCCNEIYRDQNSLAMLSAGNAVNLAFGNSTWVRIGAQCTMIANRILKCVKRQVKLLHAYQNWIDTICMDVPREPACRWNKKNCPHWVSPSIFEMWSQSIDQAIDYLLRLAERTSQLCEQLFKMSMTMMDACDACSLSPSAQNEAVNGFFLHLSDCIDILTEDKDELVVRIKENQDLINRILIGLGASYQVDLLLEHIEKKSNHKAAIDFTATEIQPTKEKIKETLKRGAFGAASAINCSNQLPDSWIPEKMPKKPTKHYDRYLPDSI